MKPYTEEQMRSYAPYRPTLVEHAFEQAQRNYYERSQPIIAKMANLVELYRAPILPGSLPEQSGWTYPKAGELYASYEEILRLIRCECFGRDAEGYRLP